MNTANYINLISNGVLTLVKESVKRGDESSLSANQYFAFLFCTQSKSYLRNYIQYKGRFNQNSKLKVYDIELNKFNFDDGFYISKYYDPIDDKGQMGRVIIVTVSDLTRCNILNTSSPTSPIPIPTPVPTPIIPVPVPNNDDMKYQKIIDLIETNNNTNIPSYIIFSIHSNFEKKQEIFN